MKIFFSILAYAVYVSLIHICDAQNIPSLVYNCQKMPAICQNVNNYYSSQGNPIDPNSGLLQDSVTLTIADPNTNNNRGQACPTSWKTSHACPEANQPNIVPEGATLASGSFLGQLAIANQQFSDAYLTNAQGQYIDTQGNVVPTPVANAEYNIIVNANTGQYSGMAFSCDEWPPNFTNQGGSNANTICAPIGVTCRSISLRSQGLTITNVNSEQNFQSSAHRGIQARVAINNPFNFFTESDSDVGSAAATVIYFDANNNEQFRFYGEGRKMRKMKRELDLGVRSHVNDTTVVKHEYHVNGTVIAQRFHYVYATENEHASGCRDTNHPLEDIQRRMEAARRRKMVVRDDLQALHGMMDVLSKL